MTTGSDPPGTTSVVCPTDQDWLHRLGPLLQVVNCAVLLLLLMELSLELFAKKDSLCCNGAKRLSVTKVERLFFFLDLSATSIGFVGSVLNNVMSTVVKHQDRLPAMLFTLTIITRLVGNGFRIAHVCQMMNRSLAKYLVGASKTRFTQKQFDLDLTYVTHTVLAMSLPAQGGAQWYRNSMGEVVRMLDYFHGGF